MHLVIDSLPDQLVVVPQPDVGGHVHDSSSDYVEWFWLPVIGPSAFVLYRRLNELLADRDSITLNTESLGSLFGLRAPLLTKAFNRLAMFGLGYFPMPATATFSLRRTLPDLPLRHAERFAPELRARFAIASSQLRQARLMGVAALVPDDGVGGLEGAVTDIAARRDALVDDGRLEFHLSI